MEYIEFNMCFLICLPYLLVFLIIYIMAYALVYCSVDSVIMQTELGTHLSAPIECVGSLPICKAWLRTFFRTPKPYLIPLSGECSGAVKISQDVHKIDELQPQSCYAGSQRGPFC